MFITPWNRYVFDIMGKLENWCERNNIHMFFPPDNVIKAYEFLSEKNSYDYFCSNGEDLKEELAKKFDIYL